MPRPLPRILLLGFGGVGRALVRRLVEVEGEGNLPWRIVGIADSKGVVWDERGVDLEGALRAKQETGTLGGPGWRAWSSEVAIEKIRPEVVVEATVADPSTGLPGTAHVLSAFRAGADVVTCNKGPLATHYQDIQDAVEKYGRQIRFGTTVGGIVPILEALVERLPVAEVQEVEAILNGSTQFVLHRLGCGYSVAAAWEEARQLGFTEPDPHWDQDGWDAAMKAAILHNLLFSPPISPREVRREGLTEEGARRAIQAIQQGRRLVSLTKVRSGHAQIELREVDANSRWALTGNHNLFKVETRRVGTLYLEGRGAGPEETACGLLADLLVIERDGIRDLVPNHGWVQRCQWPPAHPVLSEVSAQDVPTLPSPPLIGTRA